jgi:8-oxo-dGTP diphosphatase
MNKGDQKLDPCRYQLVPRTLCFVFHSDRLLLLQGAPNKRLWANLYNGIGGHVHRGEDVATAARREIREETGLEVDQLRLAGLVTMDVDPQVGVGLYVFVAQAIDHQVRPSGEGELKWFDLDSLPQGQMVDDLPQLIERVLPPNDTLVPFCAHYSYDPQDGELIITFSE